MPRGHYADGPPAADGTYWDMDEMTEHGEEGYKVDVPEEAIAVMRNPGNGGVPSVDPPGWDYLKRKHGNLKGKWVRFHIINAELGGPGNDTTNLVPTKPSLNSNGSWRNLEEGAKAVARGQWAYVEVDLEWDDDYPAGIPAVIRAEWGAWQPDVVMGDAQIGAPPGEEGGEWVVEETDITLPQVNPDQEEGGNYLPSGDITQGLLQQFGLKRDQAQIAKQSFLDKPWDSQLSFDEAYQSVKGSVGRDPWDRVIWRFQVDEDEQSSTRGIVWVDTRA